MDDFSYDFCYGDRICLVGANGIGKTSFTKTITGDQPIDSGEIIQGETVVLGVYDQLGLKFSLEEQETTLMDYVVGQVQNANSDNPNEATAPDEARRLLKKFEFPRSRWNERVFLLSGGERRRLQLLSVLSQVRVPRRA